MGEILVRTGRCVAVESLFTNPYVQALETVSGKKSDASSLFNSKDY